MLLIVYQFFELLTQLGLSLISGRRNVNLSACPLVARGVYNRIILTYFSAPPPLPTVSERVRAVGVRVEARGCACGWVGGGAEPFLSRGYVNKVVHVTIYLIDPAIVGFVL